MIKWFSQASICNCYIKTGPILKSSDAFKTSFNERYSINMAFAAIIDYFGHLPISNISAAFGNSTPTPPLEGIETLLDPHYIQQLFSPYEPTLPHMAGAITTNLGRFRTERYIKTARTGSAISTD